MPTNTGMLKTALGLHVLVWLISGCAADSTSERGWTVHDSAGVAVVENYSAERPRMWRVPFRPAVIFGDDSVPVEHQPLNPSSVFEDAWGHVIIGDGGRVGWQAILVYSGDGKFLRRIGRRGDGPGEFRNLAWASAYRGDSIVALDGAINRAKVFDPAGVFARTVRMPTRDLRSLAQGRAGVLPRLDEPFPDGSFLANAGGSLIPRNTPGPAWTEIQLVRVDATGSTETALADVKRFEQYWTGDSATRLPFASIGVAVPCAAGLITGTGKQFEFEIREEDGAVRTVVRRPHDPAPVDAAAIDEYVDSRTAILSRSPEWNDALINRRQAEVRAGYFPDHKPAYSDLRCDDDGNIWVEHYRLGSPTHLSPSRSPAVWSVFRPDGRWLTEVRLPAGFLLRSISRHQLFGIEIGALDERRAVKYLLILDSDEGG